VTRRPGRQLQVRRKRRQAPGKFKLHKPEWIDPYPFIPGTDPEKRIFDALMKKRIYFVFHGGSPPNVKLVSIGEDDHDIDFLLPEYKVIIDPFSPFAHSQLDSVQRDARKLALFAAAGYETYHPWAIAPGLFTLDQPQHTIGRWRGQHYLGSYKAPATPHTRAMGAVNLVEALPLLNAGPRFPLTDPADILAKRLYGYRIGTHLGAGAGAVAAANRARRRPHGLGLTTRR
jgi:hypothetical protein